MRYFVIDAAGRFYSRTLTFDTYDHNQALNFGNFKEASIFAKRNKAFVEVL